MTSQALPEPPQPQPQPQAQTQPQPQPPGEARIASLFRASRRAGLIHPLQHLIQRYRSETGSPAGRPGTP